MLWELIYKPRLLGYSLAVLLLLTGNQAAVDNQLILASLALAYPVIAQWCYRHLSFTNDKSRMTMLVDGVVVGALLGVFQPDAWTLLAVASALIMSTLIIAEPWLLAVVMLIVVVVASGFTLPGGWQGGLPMDPVQWMAATMVLCYSAMVSYLGFRQSTRLSVLRIEANRSREELARVQRKVEAYLPNQLLATLSGKDLASRHQFVTVCFTDLSGFTRLMDQQPEDEVAAWLKMYLERMSLLASDHGGTIDKFLGDGMMIVFGAPNSGGRQADALACVQMALAMQQSLRILRQQWRHCSWVNDLDMRVGIHSGECVVGNFGSSMRMEYTVIGSVVNLASRLEAQCEPGRVLLSKDTRALVGGHICTEPRGQAQVKGLDQPVEVFNVAPRQARGIPERNSQPCSV